MAFEDAKRTVRLEIEGEIDTWTGVRFDAWEDQDGFKCQRSTIFTAKELPSEPGPVKQISKEDFEDIWNKLIETSKDRYSVGIPDYSQRELMLMPYDPTIWTFEAKDSGKDILGFTVTGGPRTPIQEELCSLIKGLDFGVDLEKRTP